VGEGEHDAVFAFEGDGAVRGVCVVEHVVARAVLAPLVAIAALEDEDLFDADVAVRREEQPGFMRMRTVASRVASSRRRTQSATPSCRVSRQSILERSSMAEEVSSER
jgi:hypothetical protein